MSFSHTYAVHSCFKCRGYSHTSKGSANWSRSYFSLAVLMAFPLWLFSMFSAWDFPWYYGISILAGELLLFYGVGIIGGFVGLTLGVFVPKFRDYRPMLCPKCMAPLMLAGRYFKNDEKANPNDLVLSILYVAANVGVWIYALRTK